MTTKMQEYANVATLVAGVARLDEALRPTAATPEAKIAAEFDGIEKVVTALPLATDEYCFAMNWIAGARNCWRAGQLGAARYQLAMVRKKLAR
jgi:hypothetical protein